MRSTALNSAIAAVAASVLLLGVTNFKLVAQEEVARFQWPPRPGQIVNWSGEVDLGLSVGNSLPLPSGGSQAILTVPSDRWLIINYYEGFDTTLRLVERVGGQDTHKLLLNGGSGLGGPGLPLGAVGVRFRPGSEVVVQSLTTSSRKISYTSSLVGYYSR